MDMTKFWSNYQLIPRCPQQKHARILSNHRQLCAMLGVKCDGVQPNVTQTQAQLPYPHCHTPVSCASSVSRRPTQVHPGPAHSIPPAPPQTHCPRRLLPQARQTGLRALHLLAWRMVLVVLQARRSRAQAHQKGCLQQGPPQQAQVRAHPRGWSQRGWWVLQQVGLRGGVGTAPRQRHRTG